MTTVAQPLTGQDINRAARATRKALEVLLAEQGASFPPLATLNSIASRGSALSGEALVRMLANAMDVDPQTVRTVVHGLETRGLVRLNSNDHFELTAAGTAEHQRRARCDRSAAPRLRQHTKNRAARASRSASRRRRRTAPPAAAAPTVARPPTQA